ncbi:MAG TPA: hypothetical protein VKH19_05440 [Gemmatimonadaceae bacterium]|nr:hypothetical protein [Gemmatimonadaceae bacterium]
MMRHFRSIAALPLSLLAATACTKNEPPRKVVLDSVTQAGEPEEDVSCVRTRDRQSGQAFVIVHLDSAAASASRININFVEQDSTLPVHARLQGSTGAAECDGNVSLVEFKVVGAQSYLGLSVRAGTKFVAVNAMRISHDPYGGVMLNGRAYATDDLSDELVWGDAAPGDIDNQRGRMRETYPEQDRTRRQPRGLPTP